MQNQNQPEPENEVKPYPKEIINLFTREGFISSFYSYCAKFKSPQEAFEYVNDLHEKYYGRPKYTDYHTFKNVRNRFNKTFLNKNN